MHGGQMEHGVHFWETYAPVVQWTTIRMFLILALLNNWASQQIDFTLAYCQCPAETDNLYMQIPPGPCGFDKDLRKTHVLKIIMNLYGGKNSGRTWNIFLDKGLKELGCTQSKVDACVYYRGNVVFLLYCDDALILGPQATEVTRFIKELGAKFDITEESDICDYLGVKIKPLSKDRLKLYQPQLIDSILSDLGINDRSKPLQTPAHITKLPLHRDPNEPAMETDWHYPAVVGKLNFLEKSTRPDIAYAVHQCARFSTDPRRSHKQAIIHIGKYLLGTRNEGLILDPNNTSFDCWSDADFSGLWDRKFAQYDKMTSKSRTGYTIMYANCPVYWQSKLQTETTLASTESEYICLSESLKPVIHLVELMNESKAQGFDFKFQGPKMHCKAFQDNSGALEMATVHKMRPRSRHLNNRYHWFREHVNSGLVQVFKCDTKDMIADIMTKQCPAALFEKLRFALMGW
jgi:hypothetical protein